MKTMAVVLFLACVNCGESDGAFLSGREATVPHGASEGSLVHAFGKPCLARTMVFSDGSIYETITYGGQLLGADRFWLDTCDTGCDVTFYFGRSNTWELITASCPPKCLTSACPPK